MTALFLPSCWLVYLLPCCCCLAVVVVVVVVLLFRVCFCVWIFVVVAVVIFVLLFVRFLRLGLVNLCRVWLDCWLIGFINQ